MVLDNEAQEAAPEFEILGANHLLSLTNRRGLQSQPS